MRSLLCLFSLPVFALASAAQHSQVSSVAIDPTDPGLVWVTNKDNDSISVVNVGAGLTESEIDVGIKPRSLAFSGNGAQIYVANQRGNVPHDVNFLTPFSGGRDPRHGQRDRPRLAQRGGHSYQRRDRALRHRHRAERGLVRRQRLPLGVDQVLRRGHADRGARAQLRRGPRLHPGRQDDRGHRLQPGRVARPGRAARIRDPLATAPRCTSRTTARRSSRSST